MKQEVVFNNPKGARHDQYRIVDRLIDDINRATAGAEVELVVYTLSLRPVVDALSRASKRGVAVRVICDHHLKAAAVRKLADQLNAVPGSGVHFVVGAARAPHGVFPPVHTRNTHAKTWKVKYADGSYVVWVGSSNLSGFACVKQWQDMLRISADKVDSFYVFLHNLFTDQWSQRGVAHPYVHEEVSHFGVWAFPYPEATADSDPVLRRLEWVARHDHAEIYIAMHAFYAGRGMWLAKELARLAKKGFTIKVIAGEGTGRKVQDVLEQAGVQVHRGVWPDGKHIHHKLMLAKTRSGKSPWRYHVWTGSDNWTNESFRQEEIVVRTWECWDAYVKHFDTLWASSAGNKP